jgi:ribonuclease P protein component
MLPKENRLKKKTAFNATYKSGVSFHKQGVTVFCGKEKYSDVPTRIGFVVSKKVHKRAVKRNKIRRLMRESLRLYIKQNGLNTKYISLIFTASSKLLGKNFSDVNPIMLKLMEQINND